MNDIEFKVFDTIAVLILIFGLALLYYFIFVKKSFVCKHDYKIINQFEMKSEQENAGETHKSIVVYSNIKINVTDYCCSKCGKLKRLTTQTHYFI